MAEEIKPLSPAQVHVLETEVFPATAPLGRKNVQALFDTIHDRERLLADVDRVVIAPLKAERDELQRQLATAYRERDASIADLARQLAEAQKDGERLDWRLKHNHITISRDTAGEWWTYRDFGTPRVDGPYKSSREAIDAAREAE